MDNYKDCPVGIKNEQEIIRTQDTFKMALQRLEEKIDDIKEDVSTGFDTVNKRLDNLEKRIDNFEDNLPNKIDDRISQNTGDKVVNIVKWIVVSLGGGCLIGYLTNLLIHLGK